MPVEGRRISHQIPEIRKIYCTGLKCTVYTCVSMYKSLKNLTVLIKLFYLIPSIVDMIPAVPRVLLILVVTVP